MALAMRSCTFIDGVLAYLTVLPEASMRFSGFCLVLAFLPGAPSSPAFRFLPLGFGAAAATPSDSSAAAGRLEEGPGCLEEGPGSLSTSPVRSMKCPFLGLGMSHLEKRKKKKTHKARLKVLENMSTRYNKDMLAVMFPWPAQPREHPLKLSHLISLEWKPLLRHA
jgi:hypothetical protein